MIDRDVIPVCNPALQYSALRSEIDEAMLRVAGGGRYILGPEVARFEEEVAAYCGVAGAVGVNSCTDALQLALRALGVGPGDEVITTPFTFVGTSEAICQAGATPVFADIDPWTFNIDPERVEAAITPRTRAILPVHLFGRPCDMASLADIAEPRGIAIVEDCAQAMGAEIDGRPVGSFGRAGCFSFFPSKNLGGLGDGGMVVTDDPDVLRRVDSLRRHGSTEKYLHTETGLNSRLDELQAAVLRVKLPWLDRWNEDRRRIAACYDTAFAVVEGVTPPIATPTHPSATSRTDTGSVYHQYTLMVSDRDTLRRRLADLGVQTAIYYPTPLHLQPVYDGLGYVAGDFPVAERLAAQCVSLPIFPLMPRESRDRVIDAVLGCAPRRVAA